MKIEINSRFDTTDFQPEIISKLSKNGYIKYRKPSYLHKPVVIGGWIVKKPFKIYIMDA